MIRFCALGGARLERDGGAVAGRAARRHPLAILALLAASPGCAMSRDKLIAYLWPDLDDRRGRHRLNVALHVLRRELGEACIVSRGDAVVLDPAEVRTDVGEFSEAIADGRLEEATRLYDGPFLDGFFLSGAPEFEHWVDTERDRLAARFAAALEQLAREAEERGDVTTAAELLTRLAAHDPWNDRTAIRLVQTLAAAGDRAGALRRARAHAARVAADLGVEPDPELLELAARLAAGPGEAGGPAATNESPTNRADTLATESRHGTTIADLSSDRDAMTAAVDAQAHADAAAKQPVRVHAHASVPARRRRVTLAAAAAGTLALLALLIHGNRLESGDTGAAGRPVVSAATFTADPADPGTVRLADGLAEQVLSTLAYVPGLEVVTVPVTFAAGRIRAAGATAPALRQGTVIDASVAREDERFVATVTLRDARTGREIRSERMDRPVGDPDAVRAELSLAIADALRPHLVPFQPKVYTGNRRAWDRFLSGVYAHRRMTRQDLWKALQFYREGLEEDSAFALAHAISANAYMGLSRAGIDIATAYGHARDHALRSLAIDSTLAEGHVALAMVQFWHDWDFAATERSLRRAMMIYPTLPDVHNAWGDYLLFVLRLPEQAVRSYRRALEVDPLNAARSYVIEWALYRAGRYEQVVEQNAVTRSIGAGQEFGYLGVPYAAALREMARYDEAIAEYRRVQDRIGGIAPHGLAMTYARIGQAEDAIRIVRTLEQLADEGRYDPEPVARVYAALGNVDTAFEWLERARLERAPGAITIDVDPALDAIRSDPRFEELRRRIGLPR